MAIFECINVGSPWGAVVFDRVARPTWRAAQSYRFISLSLSPSLFIFSFLFLFPYLSLSVCLLPVFLSFSFSFCLSHSLSATFLFPNDYVTRDTYKIVLNIAKGSHGHARILRIRSEHPRPPQSLFTSCLVVFDIKKLIASSWGEFLRAHNHGIRTAFICTATVRRVVRCST